MRKTIASGVLGCLLGSGLTHLSHQDPSRLTTRRLEIVGETGTVGILAEVNEGGPRLDLNGPRQSGMRVEINDKTQESRVSIRGAQGEERVVLAAFQDGSARLSIGLANEEAVSLTVDKEDQASFEITQGGKAVVLLRAAEEGITMTLGGAKHGYTASLSVQPKGAQLALYRGDRPAAAMTVQADGSGLSLWDQAGTERVKVLAKENGEAGVAIYDAEGKMIALHGTPESKVEKGGSGK